MFIVCALMRFLATKRYQVKVTFSSDHSSTNRGCIIIMNEWLLF